MLCNVDELFDREEFSAAPDSGWPDCFNSGVFVFRPSLRTYNLLLQFAAEHGSFDGKGQGVRNEVQDSFHAIRQNRGRQEFSGIYVIVPCENSRCRTLPLTLYLRPVVLLWTVLPRKEQ